MEDLIVSMTHPYVRGKKYNSIIPNNNHCIQRTYFYLLLDNFHTKYNYKYIVYLKSPLTSTNGLQSQERKLMDVDCWESHWAVEHNY